MIRLLDYRSGTRQVMATIDVVDGRVVMAGSIPPPIQDMLDEMLDPTKGDLETLVNSLPKQISGSYLRAERVKDLKTAGGQGSGNFGHAGRPGEVGGSATDGGAPLDRSTLDDLLTEKSPTDYPAFFKAHGVRVLDTITSVDGKDTAYSVVLAPDRYGNTLFVVDDGSVTPQEATDWVNSQQYPEQWVDMGDFNKDFWASPGDLYHTTTEERASEIERDGLKAMNETRGLTNRWTGAAVFTFDDPEVAQGAAYGPVMFKIDMAAMKRDGYTPEVAHEEGASESDVRGALANKIGLEDYTHETIDPGGEDPSTVVVFGNIPKKYLTRMD